MRVVLDTGILIAALITTDTPPSLIYQAWRKKRFELVTSEWQLDEFRRVYRYSKLRRFLKPAAERMSRKRCPPEPTQSKSRFHSLSFHQCGSYPFFFASPVNAATARKMGSCMITETMVRRHQLSMASYDRLFPNQETLPNGGFGSLIALPLQTTLGRTETPFFRKIRSSPSWLSGAFWRR